MKRRTLIKTAGIMSGAFLLKKPMAINNVSSNPKAGKENLKTSGVPNA